MKPVHIESSVGLDRLATWNEVRYAMLLSEGDLALVGASDDSHELDPDLSDPACKLPEDLMWLTIVREMSGSKSN